MTCRLSRLEDVIGKLEKFDGYCIKLIWRECIDELDRTQTSKEYYVLNTVFYVCILCYMTASLVILFTCFLLRSPLLGDFHIC